MGADPHEILEIADESSREFGSERWGDCSEIVPLRNVQQTAGHHGAFDLGIAQSTPPTGSRRSFITVSDDGFDLDQTAKFQPLNVLQAVYRK
jgi:hypothetical protein